MVGISPADLAPGGDTATVAIQVTESDGRPVANGTVITLSAGGGVLCAEMPLPWFVSGQGSPCADATAWASIIQLETVNGVAQARLRSGSAAGSLALTARSGGITGTGAATIHGAVAPADGKIVAEPAVDTVKVGDTTVVTAFLTAADGTPLPDGTLAVFATPDDSLSRHISLTSAGFARSTLTAMKAGNADVTVTSGTVSTHATVVIVP